MMKHTIAISLALGLLTFSSCKKEGCTDPDANNYDSSAKKDDGSCTFDPPSASEQTFQVTIANNQMAYPYTSSGVFNTPVGASMPGGAAPGEEYQFTINAGPGSKLSFATMFVGSNDLFFAPGAAGIDLYPGGTLLTGDITSQIMLWDAGTEVNEMPGSGANQPMNQSGPNTGPAENGNVIEISNVTDGFTYPTVASTIQVSLAAGANANEIVVTIMNLSGSSTAIAPGVWAVHTGSNALFTPNMPDPGNGLEALAEDGNAATLGMYLESNSGLNTPFAPGVWAVHASGTPIYTSGSASSAGLEALAEDGVPTGLSTELSANSDVSMSGVFNTPDGASSPGPIFPGDSYSFTFTATAGDRLSLATMFVQSNDLFYAFADNGIELWNGGSPISGDVTSDLILLDAGTEVNEFPGFGENQAPRQSGPNTGTTESNNVAPVNDGYTYMMTSDNITVTITPM